MLIFCMELMVVVVLVNVIVMLECELDYISLQFVYYIDFEVVIVYIYNDVC